MTDEELLISYYKTVYDTEPYSGYKFYTTCYNLCESSHKTRKNFLKFATVLLIISVCIFLYKFSSANYKVLVFALISAVIFLIAKVSVILSNKEFEKAKADKREYYYKFNDLKERTPVPPIPSYLDNEQGVLALIKVFQSKRADTFKEALVIYEQDCQYRNLIARQNAMQAAIRNAQIEAEEAKKAAEQAKRDADYARMEADYHYWNSHN